MIILLPIKGKYNRNDKFPFITIPMDMPNAEEKTFDDFQWWAYSKDFAKWRAQNPRSWVADSENNDIKYADYSFIPENSVYNISSNYAAIDKDALMSYNNFGKDLSVYEYDDSEKSEDDKKFLKFHFAYNKLISDGKLDKSIAVSSISTKSDKALFLLMKDDKGENSLPTLKAYRIKQFGASSDKIKLVNVTEMLPGGSMNKYDTTAKLLKKISDDAIKIATGIGVVGIGWGLLKFSARTIRGLFLLRSIRGLPTTTVTNTPGLMSRLATKSMPTVKTIFGQIPDMVKFKNTRNAIKYGYGFGKMAADAGGGAASIAKWTAKGFLSGAKATGLRGGARLIPFVGEILMGAEVIGSIFNWQSDNQAPTFREVDNIGHEEFNPKALKVGDSITICWAQPAGTGVGIATSFVYSNDTRTTAELVKIGDNGSETIFILTQVNSKEYQEALSKHALTLISINNTEVINKQSGGFMNISNAVRRVVDNEDIDFKISYVDSISKLAMPYVYMGSCDWSLLLDYYNDASDQYITTDENAPDNYDFYYKNENDNYINVSGRLVTNDELKNKSDSDINDLFFPKEKDKNESIITDFSSFSVINEGGDEGSSPVTLTHKELSGPAKIAIYRLTKSEYADPSKNEYQPTKFKNFMIDPADYNASDNESIMVEINYTGEVINDPKRGIYKFSKDNKDKEDETDKHTSPDDDSEDNNGENDKEDTLDNGTITDDYYVSAKPEDIKIIKRKGATVIIDKNKDDGFDLAGKFLSEKEKEILGIDSWDSITLAKGYLDNKGNMIEIKLKNKYGTSGNRVKKYKITDGEAFDIAKKFVDTVESRIKYE
jgi:hypothetical protein